MESYKSLLKKAKHPHTALLVVFIVYIVLNIKTHPKMAALVDTVYGNIVVVLMALAIFANTHPVIGVVALFAAYELIQRSSVTTGSAAISRYLPSEMKKGRHLSAFNQFPITLEEEVVRQMAPLVESSGPSHIEYKPAADDTHGAMDLMNTSSVM